MRSFFGLSMIGTIGAALESAVHMPILDIGPRRPRWPVTHYRYLRRAEGRTYAPNGMRETARREAQRLGAGNVYSYKIGRKYAHHAAGATLA